MDDQARPRAERRRLTHVDRTGRPRMVDVSEKAVTARRAVAEAVVAVSPATLSLVIDGKAAKGDVLTVAEVAGVLGGKRTSELIPLCHPIGLTDLLVQVTPDRVASVLRIRTEAATASRTGVEMEALTAASIAALTVYDMVKGVERGVEIRSIRLLSKSGGRSGEWVRPSEAEEETKRERRPGERIAGRIGSRRSASSGRPAAGRASSGRASSGPAPSGGTPSGGTPSGGTPSGGTPSGGTRPLE